MQKYSPEPKMNSLTEMDLFELNFSLPDNISAKADKLPRFPIVNPHK